MNFKSCILVFRFSAMGDVAMSAAVIREFTEQNPQIQVVMVSRPAFAPFFEDNPNVLFHPLEAKGKHKGIGGLFRLFQELRTYRPIAIADLHNNLRSRLLSSYFRLTGLPIRRLDKNRKNKKELTRKTGKILVPLRPTVEAYADVFIQLGFLLKLSHKLIKVKKEIPESYQELFSTIQKAKIGISPFAQHIQKVYPLDKMEMVIEKLSATGHHLFIFGGGPDEKQIAEEWANRFENVTSLIGKTSLSEELAIISKLNLMLAMDSAGMHMASLMGIDVVSIWGATHPYAGFLGYGQNEKDCIQLAIHCRPCSVYGNKPCYRGDLACMHGIDSGIIIAHINQKLHNEQGPTSD